MWSGSIASVPSGWALCNGLSGTPDLRDRFIVGAGSSYAPGNTGGANSVVLTEGQLAAHNHTGSTNTTGAHTHTYTGHRSSNYDLGGNTAEDTSKQQTENTGSAGNHNHTLNINNAGSNQAHENRPPYYALAFIMKL